MSRNSTWSNPDGVVVGFGPHSLDNDVLQRVAGAGTVKQVQVEFTGVGLEALASVTTASLKPQAVRIRRGSRITSASITVTEAFTLATGTPALSIGTYNPDTAVVDVGGGILSAAALATLDAIGEPSAPAGTLVNGTLAVGRTSLGDVTILPSVSAAATYATGKAILTVTYIEPAFGTDPLLAV